MRDSDKAAEDEGAKDVEMEDLSKKLSSPVLDESAKCKEDKELIFNTLVEPSKKQRKSKSPSKTAPEESCNKQDKEGNKPSSNQLEESPKRQEDKDEHKKASPNITEKTPQKQQEESKKPSPDMLQEPSNKQIVVRRARDRCVVFYASFRYHINSLS